jgi:hypothetical protein
LRPLVDAQTRQSRKQQAFAVTHKLPELIALGRQRYRWVAELEAQVQAVAKAVQAGTATLPVQISQPDLNGAQEVHFRVWDRLSWQMAHQGRPTRRALKAVDRPPRPPFYSGLFLQLVGDLPEHPWFLRAVAQGALHGSKKLAQTAQAYLQAINAPNFLVNYTPGLLKPTRSLAWTLHFAREQASGTLADSTVLFCVEPLLAAASVAHFTLISLVSTGMRIGELQQVTLDHTCMESSQLPQFDDHSQNWLSGPKRLYWKLYPKGASERERYLVSAQMVEAMFMMLDLHKRYYGPDSIEPVPPCRLSHFHHAHRFQGQRKFVLQWAGQHIASQAIIKCLVFLLLEHGCRDADGQMVHITPHLLRHGVAGWLRQHGIPLEDIMALLKQVNIAVTDYYSRPSPQELYQKIGPALTALADLADTDPTTIRTVGDIQSLANKALKRYGVLRQTPGGTCAVFTPCQVQFKCASCPAYIPDPARRQEVEEKITSHKKAVELFTAVGDYLQADVQTAYLRDWERVQQEMKVLTQVDLIDPPPEGDLPVVTDDLGHQLRQSLAQLPKLVSGGPQAHG